MFKPIGQYLDDPKDFFFWLVNNRATFIAINAAIESGFLNKLSDTPNTIAELSSECGIPNEQLKRLVNILAAEEIISLLPDDKVKHTSRSRNLASFKSNIECSIIAFEAGFHLYEAMLKGVTSYEHQYGLPVFEHLDQNPKPAASLAGSMSYLTKLAEEFIFTQHKFNPFNIAVDIGGSHGGLLIKLLEKFPNTNGVLFDRPEVAAKFHDEVKNSQQGSQIEVIGGDFFESVPEGDLYLLKMILHDWNDEECIAILKNIRKAISPGGRVCIIDFLLPETPTHHPGYAMDITMMVWSTGKERKLSEFKSLLETADFEIDRVTENQNGQGVIEAVAI